MHHEDVPPGYGTQCSPESGPHDLHRLHDSHRVYARMVAMDELHQPIGIRIRSLNGKRVPQQAVPLRKHDSSGSWLRRSSSRVAGVSHSWLNAWNLAGRRR